LISVEAGTKKQRYCDPWMDLVDSKTQGCSL